MHYDNYEPSAPWMFEVKINLSEGVEKLQLELQGLDGLDLAQLRYNIDDVITQVSRFVKAQHKNDRHQTVAPVAPAQVSDPAD